MFGYAVRATSVSLLTRPALPPSVSVNVKPVPADVLPFVEFEGAVAVSYTHLRAHET